MRFLIGSTAFFLSWTFTAQIQLDHQVIGSAGQSNTSGTIQMDNTVGETFTKTLEGGKVHTLGFQQPEFKETVTETGITIPGGLSPNNDNMNDTWVIGGLDQYPESKITVFNRWGQTVYEGEPNSAPWDGTSKSNALPVGDYYYIIDLGDGTKYNGVVTLKR